MQIRSLKLADVHFGEQWSREVESRWTHRDFLAHPEWRNGWISFVCAQCRPEDDRVYLGVTSFNANNIFQAYDRASGRFVDLGYSRVADRFDAKFHRSLVQHADGCLYAAPALLHCPDQYHEAPGASIVKYDPATGALEKLGVVLPHVYIQALAIDPRRETLYCECFAPEYLAAFDLRSREGRNLGLLGSGYGGLTISENIAVDDHGRVWCNWSLTRAWQDEPGADAARLGCYDPEQDRIHFFQKGLPYPDGKPGFAKAEAFFNLGDGWMYASGANGSLYRIDPESGDAEWLMTPTPDRPSRLTSLVKTSDGVAYGITGRLGQCELTRFEYAKGSFEKLGPMADPEGVAMYQCHDIVAASDGTLYACENDNPQRSSYLWEIVL